MKKTLLADTPARLLITVGENPGLTTSELIKKIKGRRLQTVYTILRTLVDKNMLLVGERHGGKESEGRPSFVYSLSPKGEKHAELYRKLFALEKESWPP